MSFGLLKTTQPPIAVDFGVSTLKVLQIVPGNPPTLVSAVCAEMPVNYFNRPQDRLVYQSQILPDLLKQGDFRGKRAICSISASVTFVQHLRITPIPGTPTKVLLGDLVLQHTGRDASQFILRHMDIAEINRAGRKRTEVLCIGIPRESVLGHMKALRGAKLEPVGVHIEHVAMVRSLDCIHRRASDRGQTTMLVDFGYGTTKIAISHGREPSFAKTLLVGGYQFDKATARTYGCSFREARERRATHVAELTNPLRATQLEDALATSAAPELAHTGGGRDQVEGEGGLMSAHTPDPDQGQLEDAQEPHEERRHGAASASLASLGDQSSPPSQAGVSAQDLMEAIADEVLLSVRHHESLFPKRPISRIVFTGGESARTDLCGVVAERLKMDARVADPLSILKKPKGIKGVGVDLDQPAPGWAVAVGLCNAPTDL